MPSTDEVRTLPFPIEVLLGLLFLSIVVEIVAWDEVDAIFFFFFFALLVLPPAKRPQQFTDTAIPPSRTVRIGIANWFSNRLPFRESPEPLDSVRQSPGLRLAHSPCVGFMQQYYK